MRIIPTDPDDWQNRYARILARMGWTCHPPGTSCIGENHVYTGKQETSYGASVYAKPRTGTQRGAVLEMLMRRPATDVELQEWLSMSPNTERPRRVELVEGGFVQDSGRVKRHHGREHIVWEATEVIARRES